jgi:hypothetical protein
MANPGEFALDSDGALMSVNEGLGLPEGFQVFNANGKTLFCRYTVTCLGLGGDFAKFNGDNVVDYFGYSWAGIYWRNQDEWPVVILMWDKQDSRWLIRLLDRVGCDKYWRSVSGEAPCDPSVSPYEEHFCKSNGCFDMTSCESSEDATVTVSHGVPQ